MLSYGFNIAYRGRRCKAQAESKVPQLEQNALKRAGKSVILSADGPLRMCRTAGKAGYTEVSVKKYFSHMICAFAAMSKAAIGFADRHKK